MSGLDIPATVAASDVTEWSDAVDVVVIGFGIGGASVFMVQAVGKDAPAPDERTLGVHHMAFIVGNNPATLSDAAQQLDRHGVRYQRVMHEEFESLFCRDPDGHLIELYYWPSW